MVFKSGDGLGKAMVSAMGEAATGEAKVMAVMAKVAMEGSESGGGDGGGDGGGCDGCNDGGGDGCGGALAVETTQTL